MKQLGFKKDYFSHSENIKFSLHKLLLSLKKVSIFFVKMQTLIFLFLAYFLFVIPFGILFQLVTSLKNSKAKKKSSYWVKAYFDQDLIKIYRQF